MTRVATLERSFPTFLLIAAPFRWIGKSRRRVWCLVGILLAMVSAPPLWWATQLVGLPDIGDPFDVKAFEAKTIPDERNAFVLYRQAAAVYKHPSDLSEDLPIDLRTKWSTATPKVRRWAEMNREALALFRRGADQPDALDSSIMFVGEYAKFDALRPLQRLSLLEASRQESLGDMAGAWGWYRAYLRTIHHVGRYSRIYRRRIAQDWHKHLHNRLIGWAFDPRTTPAQLRQALDDVLACEALIVSEPYTIEAEYLAVDRMFDKGIYGVRPMQPAWLTTIGSWGPISSLGGALTPEQRGSISEAWSFWRREPERCRRVIRLITANRLAYYDLPPGQRPSPDPNVLSCDLYSFGPEAPANARVLSPKALGGWLDSTHDAKELIGWMNPRGLRSKELANQRSLVILLASELYRRDHGTDPPTPEALVGPYLKSLPAEFTD